MIATLEAAAAKLVENEEAIGRLYQLFATTFPDDAPLWTGLAQEEAQHAEWIRQAVESAPADAKQRPLPSIRVQAVVSMTAYIQSIVDRCGRGELGRLNALALARDIENSLLEGKLLEALGASPFTGEVDKALVAATGAHRRRIAAAIERLR